MSVLEDLVTGSRRYHKKMHQLTEPLKSSFGLNEWGYVKIDNDGSLINLHSQLDWLEHCLDMKYFVDDPHMISPEHIESGMALWSTYEEEEYLTGMLRDAIETYDLCHGITYVDKTDKGYEVFGFSTSIDNHLVQSKILNHLDYFKSFVKNLQKEVDVLNQELDDYKVDFPALKGPAYYNQAGIVTVLEEEREMQENFLAAINCAA